MEPTDDEACPRPVRLSGAAVPFQRSDPARSLGRPPGLLHRHRGAGRRRRGRPADRGARPGRAQRGRRPGHGRVRPGLALARAPDRHAVPRDRRRSGCRRRPPWAARERHGPRTGGVALPRACAGTRRRQPCWLWPRSSPTSWRTPCTSCSTGPSPRRTSVPSRRCSTSRSSRRSWPSRCSSSPLGTSPPTAPSCTPASATEASAVATGTVLGLAVTGLMLLASPLVAAAFDLGGILPAVLVAAGVLPTYLTFAAQGCLLGRERFGALGVVFVVVAGGRFVAGAGAAWAGLGVSGVIGATVRRRVGHRRDLAGDGPRRRARRRRPAAHAPGCAPCCTAPRRPPHCSSSPTWTSRSRAPCCRRSSPASTPWSRSSRRPPTGVRPSSPPCSTRGWRAPRHGAAPCWPSGRRRSSRWSGWACRPCSPSPSSASSAGPPTSSSRRWCRCSRHPVPRGRWPRSSSTGGSRAATTASATPCGRWRRSSRRRCCCGGTTRSPQIASTVLAGGLAVAVYGLVLLLGTSPGRPSPAPRRPPPSVDP